MLLICGHGVAGERGWGSRFYLKLVFDEGGDVRARAVFFDKSTKIGRLLDDGAAVFGERSENHKSGLTGLVAYNGLDGSTLGTGASLGNLEEAGTVFSGGVVVLTRLAADAIASRLELYKAAKSQKVPKR